MALALTGVHLPHPLVAIISPLNSILLRASDDVAIAHHLLAVETGGVMASCTFSLSAPAMCWLTDLVAVYIVRTSARATSSVGAVGPSCSAVWLAAITRGSRACFEVDEAGVGGLLQLMLAALSSLCVVAGFSSAGDAYAWLAGASSTSVELLSTTSTAAAASASAASAAAAAKQLPRSALFPAPPCRPASVEVDIAALPRGAKVGGMQSRAEAPGSFGKRPRLAAASPPQSVPSSRRSAATERSHVGRAGRSVSGHNHQPRAPPFAPRGGAARPQGTSTPSTGGRRSRGPYLEAVPQAARRGAAGFSFSGLSSCTSAQESASGAKRPRMCESGRPLAALNPAGGDRDANEGTVFSWDAINESVKASKAAWEEQDVEEALFRDAALSARRRAVPINVQEPELCSPVVVDSRTPAGVCSSSIPAGATGDAVTTLRHLGGASTAAADVVKDAPHAQGPLRASPPMDPNTQTPKRGTVLPNGHWWLGCDPKLGCDGPKIDHPHIF